MISKGPCWEEGAPDFQICAFLSSSPCGVSAPTLPAPSLTLPRCQGSAFSTEPSLTSWATLTSLPGLSGDACSVPTLSLSTAPFCVLCVCVCVCV